MSTYSSSVKVKLTPSVVEPDPEVNVPPMLEEGDCSSAGAFCRLRNTLIDFQNSIVEEMANAKTRRAGELQWCDSTISNQVRTVAERKEKVDSLTEHLTWLRNEKQERENDRDHKAQRIQSNLEMLEQFKKKRCDSNLIFVKNLREHMDAIQIMRLLKDDIAEYFRNRNANDSETVQTPVQRAKENAAAEQVAEQQGQGMNANAANMKENRSGAGAGAGATGLFIEKLMAYTHLFNDEHKQIFLQVKQHVEKIMSTEENNRNLNEDAQNQANADADTALSYETRSNEQIGEGHVDNKREVLQALEHPPHEKYSVWAAETERKVLRWVDQLINHLKDSKNKLTEYEIKAATDFAIWHRNMLQENDRLQNRIEVLNKEIAEFSARIKVAEEQLARRQELLTQAQDLLGKVRGHCEEMRVFYAQNVTRRAGEYETAVAANQIYEDVMSRFKNSRETSRINAHQETGEGFGENDLAAHVVPSEPAHSEQLNSRVASRNEVVFY